MKITEMEKGARKSAPKKAAESDAERRDLPAPFAEMERLFETLMPGRWMRGSPWDWPALAEFGLHPGGRLPHIDVVERDNDVLVRAELPGVDRKDIDVSLADCTLTLRAETHHEKRDEQGDYHRCEIAHGAFTRTVALPADVDAEKTTATFADGLLELVLPKVEKAQKKRIPVA